MQRVQNRSFIPFDESIVRSHIEGNITVGTYTIRDDDTCIFLAADFDKEQWGVDALTYKAAAKDMGVEVYVERSRSGTGGHAWIFFQEPIAAHMARYLGTLILTHAMTRRHHIGFDSYDRFFPSQDTMPSGGFGNLIALPLQRIPRRSGNSVFVDDDLAPYPDQWEYLSRVRLLTGADVAAILHDNAPSATQEHKTDQASAGVVEAETSIDTAEEKIKGIHAGPISFVYSRHLEISIRDCPRSSSPLSSGRLPSPIRSSSSCNGCVSRRGIRPATSVPRSCRTTAAGMIVPRGLWHAVCACGGGGSERRFEDLRRFNEALRHQVHGGSPPPQKSALRRPCIWESGVLVAPPGSGKTVIACAV